MYLKVTKIFTDTPGGRYKSEGPYSAELFRDTILYPQFMYSLNNDELLTVDLDDGYGYGSGFLEESFGGLVRKLYKENNEYYKRVSEINIISNDNLSWKDKISGYIHDEIERINYKKLNKIKTLKK